MLKSVNQQSANVVRGIVNWSHHFAAAFFTHPIGCSTKERLCHLVIVDAIKQSEATDAGLMERVIIWIVARHDSPNDFAIASRQEQCRLAMLIKWMTLAIEKGFTLD